MRGKILYIEDEINLLNLVMEVLERSGFEVLGATDGLEGIKLALSERPDLILLDLNLPTMSGWEVITKLQGEKLFRNIPIVIITGESDEEGMEKSIAAGSSGFLRKPLNFRELPEIIEEYMQGKKQEIEITTEKREGYLRQQSRDLVNRLQEQVENLTSNNRKITELNKELKQRDVYVQSMLDPLWVLDTNGCSIDYNPALLKFLECTEDDLTNSEVWDFLDGENLRKVKETDQFRKESLGSSTYQVEFRTKSGNRKSAIISGQPIMEDGKFIGTFAVIKDMTDRLLLEERYESIFNNTVEGLYQCTLEGRIITANPSLVELLGYESEEDLKSVNLVEEVHARRQEAEEYMDVLYLNKQAIFHEKVFRRKDGKEITVLDSSRIIEHPRYSGPIIEGSIVDITKRKKLEEEKEKLLRAMEEKNLQLKEANRLKDEFLANMSHELRTPLNSIIGFSEVLVDGLSGEMNEEQLEFTENIRTSGLHLLELINGILDLSKIRAGMMTINPKAIELKSLGMEICSTFMPQAHKKNIKWETIFPDHDVNIYADPLRIKQVILNIVGNAFKFTPDEGTVGLNLYTINITDWDNRIFTLPVNGDANAAVMEISDSGIGIKESDFDNIFDEFRQVDGSYTRQIGGTGLGLPIAKKFVELHEGEIWVSSNPDKGSTFTLVLPLDDGTRNSNEISI